MPIPAYRAKQSTDTAGTGTIVLNAAGTNARNFSAAFGASARRVFYCIQWASGFEIGYGDFDGGTPGSLTRATVVASSNAGALVTLPAGTKDVFAVFDTSAREVVAISGTSTLALADLGNVINFTGSSAATLNLPAVATVPIGAGFMVWNTGTAALTIDPNGAETVNGAATLALQAGAYVEVLRLSVGWMACVPALPSIGGAISGPLLGPAGTAGAPAYSASIGSSTGIFFPNAGALGFSLNGTEYLRLDSAFLTYSVGSNSVAMSNDGALEILRSAGGAYIDFKNAAGEDADVRISESSNGLSFLTGGNGALTTRFVIPASDAVTVDGKALQIQRGTEQTPTGVSTVDFIGLPSGVRRVTIMLDGISFAAGDTLNMQLGTSGGVETSGYSGFHGIVAGTASGSISTSLASALSLIFSGISATDALSGVIEMFNQSGNKWAIKSKIGRSGTNQIHEAVGFKTVSAVLDRVRIRSDAASNFDAGTINIFWEF